jgi:hypothetical protein
MSNDNGCSLPCGVMPSGSAVQPAANEFCQVSQLQTLAMYQPYVGKTFLGMKCEGTAILQLKYHNRELSS